MRYKHPGSYETITGENGNLVEKLSFDPCLPCLVLVCDEDDFTKAFEMLQLV